MKTTKLARKKQLHEVKELLLITLLIMITTVEYPL